jgi:FlaG/FlaF family flagellin (archaellin)
LEKLFETRLRGILLNKKVGAILPRSAVSVALILVLLLPSVSGVEYEAVEYIDGSMRVSVQISADTPWVAPFSESVSISVNVTPPGSAVQEVNVSRISLIVNRLEADQSGYVLVSAENVQGSPLATGLENTTYKTNLTLSGDKYGDNCYFALLVAGSYRNGTELHYFEAVSPDDLIGPFSISASIVTPQVWVGIVVLLGAFAFFACGAYGVKKSRSEKKRSKLLEE